MKTQAEANERIETKLKEAFAKYDDLKKSLGDFTQEEMDAAKKDFDLINFNSITERKWGLVALDNLKYEIKSLTETRFADLIFAKGKYVLLPEGQGLVSPSGFHPDEAVFIKPAVGVVVDKLPKSSNMGYLDFTK